MEAKRETLSARRFHGQTRGCAYALSQQMIVSPNRTQGQLCSRRDEPEPSPPTQDDTRRFKTRWREIGTDFAMQVAPNSPASDCSSYTQYGALLVRGVISHMIGLRANRRAGTEPAQTPNPRCQVRWYTNVIGWDIKTDCRFQLFLAAAGKTPFPEAKLGLLYDYRAWMLYYLQATTTAKIKKLLDYRLIIDAACNGLSERAGFVIRRHVRIFRGQTSTIETNRITNFTALHQTIHKGA